MQRFAGKVFPDFHGQRLNALLNPATRNQNSDLLPRHPSTLLHGFFAFRHPFPRTWHRDSNARSCCGARHTCDASLLEGLYRLNKAQSVLLIYSGGQYFPARSIRASQSAWGSPERKSSFASLSTSYSTRRMVMLSPSITRYDERVSPSYDWLTLPVFATLMPCSRRRNGR